MPQKQRRKPITDMAVENTKETFHLGFTVAPVIATAITYFFRKDIHLVIELVFIIIVIAVNFYILWLRSKTEENKELSLFYTFLTNDVLPNQSGDEQTYNVVVAVIEDKDNSDFRDGAQTEFKTKVNLKKVRDILSKEPKLKNPILEKLMDILSKEPKSKNPILKEQLLEALVSQ